MVKPEWLRDIRVVGFDLDQTLYPKSPLIDEMIQSYLYEKIATQRDVSPEVAKDLFNERYRNGAGMSGGQTLRDLGLANGSDLVQEALEHADIASVLSPDIEINKLLGQLSAKYEGVDLITGSNMRQTHMKLNALGIQPDTFSHILTADDGSKSGGDNFRNWLALYPHLTPGQFLYVGDRPRTDHEIPSALGIKTALVYVKIPDPALPCPQYSSTKKLLDLLS